MFADDFLFGGCPAGGVCFLERELLERFKILHLALKLAHRVEQIAESRNFLDHDLGTFPIRPEIRGSHPRFELAQPGLQTRQVKETSAIRPPWRAVLRYRSLRFPWPSGKITESPPLPIAAAKREDGCNLSSGERPRLRVGCAPQHCILT